MKRNVLNYAGLVIVAVIWGTNFGIIRYAMESFNPILFALLRFGGSVPFFFVLLKYKEGSIGIPWRVALQLLAIGFLGITLLEIATMYSIKFTTLANASLLSVAPWPIFAAILAPFFTREGITKRLVIGGFIAIMGVSLVILGGGAGLSLSSTNLWGNFIALGISIVGAVYNLSCVPLLKRYSALRVTAWHILFGAIFMFPFTLGSWHKVAWSNLAGSDYLLIGYNVICCTVIAYVLWNACMYRIGTAKSNFFRYVVPAAAVLAGYYMFGENITVWQIAGASCMAAGLVWISRNDSLKFDYK